MKLVSVVDDFSGYKDLNKEALLAFGASSPSVERAARRMAEWDGNVQAVCFKNFPLDGTVGQVMDGVE